MSLRMPGLWYGTALPSLAWPPKLSAILQFVVENIELYGQILHVQLQYILQNTTLKLEVQWLGFTSKGA